MTNLWGHGYRHGDSAKTVDLGFPETILMEESEDGLSNLKRGVLVGETVSSSCARATLNIVDSHRLC